MRFPVRNAALAGALVALAGCSNQPSVHDIENKAELRTITVEDGREIECLFYSDTGAYASWLVLDCDWESR